MRRTRRAGLVLAAVAGATGVVGAVAAVSSDDGVVVGVGDIELNLYAVNVAGGLALLAIGFVAATSVLSGSAVPLWVASGMAGFACLFGLLAWRDDTHNALGLDGRTISLLLGLAVSFAAVAWADGQPTPDG